MDPSTYFLTISETNCLIVPTTLLFIFFELSTAARVQIPKCNGPYDTFGFDEPENQSIQSNKLLELTEWIDSEKVPILSLLISKNGKLVYEAYTSRLTRDHSHYLMSVTKSITSALVGAAIDRQLIKGPDQTLAAILPRKVFADENTFKRFQKLTLRHILGMSALDAPVSPHLNTPEGVKRATDFFQSKNRLQFALRFPLLSDLGKQFQYTDITPALLAGAIQYTTHKTMLEFAN